MNKEEALKLQPSLRITPFFREHFTRKIMVDNGLSVYLIKKPNSYREIHEGHYDTYSDERTLS